LALCQEDEEKQATPQHFSFYNYNIKRDIGKEYTKLEVQGFHKKNEIFFQIMVV